MAYPLSSICSPLGFQHFKRATPHRPRAVYLAVQTPIMLPAARSHTSLGCIQTALGSPQLNHHAECSCCSTSHRYMPAQQPFDTSVRVSSSCRRSSLQHFVCIHLNPKSHCALVYGPHDAAAGRCSAAQDCIPTQHHRTGLIMSCSSLQHFTLLRSSSSSHWAALHTLVYWTPPL